MNPVLELIDVTHQFETTTFEKINLQVSPGEIVCILGRSGEGKSTLLHCIAGFHSIKKGMIKINGTLMASSKENVPPEKRKAGIVLQDAPLFPHLNVKKNIAFALKKNTVDAMLDLIGLPHLATKYPHEISGGERQRVALARTLAAAPDILLLDETFSHLDQKTKEPLMEEFRSLLKKLSLPVLHVTHDSQEAFSFADRIAIMDQGIFLQTATPQDLYLYPKNERILSFLGNYCLMKGKIENKNPLEISSSLGIFTYENTICSTPHLVIRAENIDLDSKGPHSGKIIKRKYLGACFEYIVDFKNHHLPLKGDKKFEVGEFVKFQILHPPTLLGADSS